MHSLMTQTDRADINKPKERSKSKTIHCGWCLPCFFKRSAIVFRMEPKDSAFKLNLVESFEMLYNRSPTLNAYKVYGVYYAIFDHNSLDHWSYCHKDEAVLPFHSKLPHTTALKSIQPVLIIYIKRAVLTFKHAMQNKTDAK